MQLRIMIEVVWVSVYYNQISVCTMRIIYDITLVSEKNKKKALDQDKH